MVLLSGSGNVIVCWAMSRKCKSQSMNKRARSALVPGEFQSSHHNCAQIIMKNTLYLLGGLNTHNDLTGKIFVRKLNNTYNLIGKIFLR